MKCNQCNDREGFIRTIDGGFVCIRCFIERIEKKVKKTIEDFNLIVPGDRVVVAISGGTDSVSLLHILSKLDSDNFFSLRAIIIDEGIKGYSEKCVTYAKDNCTMLGVKYDIWKFKDIIGFELDEIISQQKKVAPCALCVPIKRRILNLSGLKVEATKLATGHTLDDTVEGFIIGLLNGNPSEALASKPILPLINSRFVPRIKPLYKVTKMEIATYASILDLKSENTKCPYSKIGIRDKVRAVLSDWEKEYPDIKYKLLSSLQKMQQTYPTNGKELKITRCTVCGEPSANYLCELCTLLNKLKLGNHWFRKVGDIQKSI